VILFCSVVSFIVSTPTELKSFAESGLGPVLFFQNFLLMNASGYFDAASETKPLLHIWSLAVEEQFYILFSLALVLAVKFKRSRIVPRLVLLAIVFSLIIWLV